MHHTKKTIMKTQTTLLTTLSKEQVKQLTTQVKETLAAGFNSNEKIFSAADMWNIQRRRKTISIR